MVTLPTLADVRAADTRIRPFAIRTPLVESQSLNERAGGRVLLKLETLQRVGAFKFRGAFNKISRLRKADHPGGIVACSSGNHAQGVAHAATLLGYRSAIVMPRDAPAMKIERTKAFGGEVITYDREQEDRDAITRDLCRQRDAAMVLPFDDPDIIAGQGTAGLEIVEQAEALGAVPDLVLVPCSGGGLVSGIAIAIAAAHPKAQIYSVEPEQFDDFKRSLASGKAETNMRKSGSICDALMAEKPGNLTFAVCRGAHANGLAVSEDSVRRAVRYAFEALKLVVEPGGAVGLAAILDGQPALAGRTAVVVLSGGNIDAKLFSDIIAGA